jgi:hypothetical protein
LPSVQPPVVDLGDMSDEFGFRAAGVAREAGESIEELLVGDRLEGPLWFHEWNIGLGFSRLWATA